MNASLEALRERTSAPGARRPSAAELFDVLWETVSRPSPSIQEDLILLVDTLGCPVTDPTSAGRDLVLRIVDRDPFPHQLVVTRMLVAAGAPLHQETKNRVNSKFENLWSLIVSPEFEQAFYDGPISLLASHEADRSR